MVCIKIRYLKQICLYFEFSAPYLQDKRAGISNLFQSLITLFLYILSACTYLVLRLFSLTSEIIDPLILENHIGIFPFSIQDFMFTDFPNSKGQSRIFRFNKNISESYIDKYIFSSLRQYTKNLHISIHHQKMHLQSAHITDRISPKL